MRSTVALGVSMQMKPFTVAYLLRDCFRKMSVFAVRRSFIPFAFDRESHDLLGRYARREREASLQQYNVTYTCSLTVPANVALLLLSTHSLGALHASGGVPAACAYSIGKVVRRMCHEEIVGTAHVNLGAKEVVSVRVAHGGVRDPV